MNNFSRPTAYYGQSSTMSRMQQQYWTTKQAFFRKIGRKEDDCIIASDAELDAKLELFNAIQHSASNLLRVLENYQDRILGLSQEENALGRFLKECGKQDKTRAGKMMGATGKAMSYSAQQRLTLRVPLVRLYQEVETYQFRAIADTLGTVRKMEHSRTDYRGALLWMKDISQQLDPDTYKQLEKFRKVQGHVKRTKMHFEKLKLDTLQKVDLLAASRCNMFSHVLATYQNALLSFWEKTSSTMTNVAESFKGYQHFDFVVVKELQEPSRRLAREMGNGEDNASKEDSDKDRMLLTESECHDEEGKQKHKKIPSSCGTSRDDVPLLSLDSTLDSAPVSTQDSSLPPPAAPRWKQDLLTNNPEVADLEKDDMTLLSEILSSSEALYSLTSEEGFTQQWQTAFGNLLPSPQKSLSFGGSLGGTEPATAPATTPLVDAPAVADTQFLPSQLLDLEDSIGALHMGVSANAANQPEERICNNPVARYSIEHVRAEEPSLEPLKPTVPPPKQQLQPVPFNKPFKKAALFHQPFGATGITPPPYFDFSNPRRKRRDIRRRWIRGGIRSSSSQLLFDRRLQTRVPKLNEALIPAWPSQEDFQSKDKAARGRRQRDFNRRHRVQRLRSLSVGEDVWVDDISCAAKVLSPAKRPRSYVVETPSGVIQRNRRHLVPFDASDSQQQNAGPRQKTSGSSSVVAANSEASMLNHSSSNAHRPLQTLSCDDVNAVTVHHQDRMLRALAEE